FENADELAGVDVINIFRARMALELTSSAELLVVAGKAKTVLEAERRGAEEICLHGDAVPVPAGHLHDRLQTLLQCNGRSCDARYPNNGSLAVRDVRCVAKTLQLSGFLDDFMGICAHGRTKFSCDCRFAAREYLFECASTFHYCLQNSNCRVPSDSSSHRKRQASDFFGELWIPGQAWNDGLY